MARIRESRFRIFLDRIEGEVAVLLLGDAEQDRIEIPLKYLPRGLREGIVLTGAFTVEEEETEAARSRVQALIDELTG